MSHPRQPSISPSRPIYKAKRGPTPIVNTTMQQCGKGKTDPIHKRSGQPDIAAGVVSLVEAQVILEKSSCLQ